MCGGGGGGVCVWVEGTLVEQFAECITGTPTSPCCCGLWTKRSTNH